MDTGYDFKNAAFYMNDEKQMIHRNAFITLLFVINFEYCQM